MIRVLLARLRDRRSVRDDVARAHQLDRARDVMRTWTPCPPLVKETS